MYDLFLALTDRIFGFLLAWPPGWAVFARGAATALLITLVQKLASDQRRLARLKADLKVLKRLLREARRRRGEAGEKE